MHLVQSKFEMGLASSLSLAALVTSKSKLILSCMANVSCYWYQAG